MAMNVDPGNHTGDNKHKGMPNIESNSATIGETRNIEHYRGRARIRAKIDHRAMKPLLIPIRMISKREKPRREIHQPAAKAVFALFLRPLIRQNPRICVPCERFLQEVRIGRSLRSFPPSKRSMRLSPHCAFRYSDEHNCVFFSVSRWIRFYPPECTSQSTAQPVAWSPPLCWRTWLHYSFRHLPSLVHPFLPS